MIINHYSFSKSGGAGLVALNLVENQVQLGHESMLKTLISTDLYREPFAHPSITLRAAADKYLVSNKTKPTLISPLRSRHGSKGDSLALDGDIVHLHWLPGFISTKRIFDALSLGKKIIWTLHDMEPFTGGCHHAFDCVQYTRDCSRCPQVRVPFRHIVRAGLTTKTQLSGFADSGMLKLAAPSKWLADRISASSVFREFPIEVIQNPINEAFVDLDEGHWNYSFQKEDFLVVVVASNLSDPNKKIKEIVTVFKSFLIETGAQDVKLILVGDGGNQFSGNSENIICVGKKTSREISNLARHTNLLLSFSTAESASMTLREFGARGCPSLCIDTGVQGEFVETGQNGFVCRDLVHAQMTLRKVLELRDRENLARLGANARTKAIKLNSPGQVAKTYLQYYGE